MDRHQTKNRMQKTENRKQKTENRKQKTENRKQKTENRKQKGGGVGLTNASFDKIYWRKAVVAGGQTHTQIDCASTNFCRNKPLIDHNGSSPPILVFR